MRFASCERMTQLLAKHIGAYHPGSSRQSHFPCSSVAQRCSCVSSPDSSGRRRTRTPCNSGKVGARSAPRLATEFVVPMLILLVAPAVDVALISSHIVTLPAPSSSRCEPDRARRADRRVIRGHPGIPCPCEQCNWPPGCFSVIVRGRGAFHPKRDAFATMRRRGIPLDFSGCDMSLIERPKQTKRDTRNTMSLGDDGQCRGMGA